jgi:hypothetical protein
MMVQIDQPEMVTIGGERIFNGTQRIETGPIQFGDDWPGVFIRGDNAFGYAMALRSVIANALHSKLDPIAILQLKGLAETLEGCVVKK